MKATINSRNHGEIEFFCPNNGGYVFISMNGKHGPGTLGNQICHGGHLSGSTESYHGNADNFEKYCRKWWDMYLRNVRKEEVER